MAAADPAAFLGRIVVALVRVSIRRPWTVLAMLALVSAGALWLTATRFVLDSDVTKLFSPDLPWRVAERTMERAFPQRLDLIVIVLDGPDAATSDRAAGALAGALQSRPELFRSVRQPGGGPFWASHGLLYLDRAEVQSVTEKLVEAQGLLGPLAEDPSLRGLGRLLGLIAEGIKGGDANLGQLAGPLGAFAQAAEGAVQGRVAAPDWGVLMTGRPARPLELRRLILVQPALNYEQLSAGAAATEVIRSEARRLGIDGEHGLRIRLTGSVPMADEEFATVSEGAIENAVLSFVLVAILLWMALHSWKLIWPLLVLVVAGLIWTAGWGILSVGSFNPLSIAFAVLFIGIGVDFGIQYAVQYRAERVHLPALLPALEQAARTAGPGMTLAALAVTFSFLAFLPTDYRGVAELGLIAGGGMVIGWFLAMTLLPALMVLARPSSEAREVGYPMLRPVDEWLSRHARPVGIGVAVLALACLGALAWLRFDTNPINLRDPHSESVATWRDLARDPDTDPNILEVLAPDLMAAQALARRLAALPEVARAMTLADFIPEDQDAKLALIEDAAMLLGPALAAEPMPPPDDAAVVAALRKAAADLAPLRGNGPVHRDTARLAAALARLADGPVANRDVFASATLPGLTHLVGQVRALLAAHRVTLESLPPDLIADWITPDGRARVEMAPAQTTTDETLLFRRFARAVQAVAPDATGLAVSTQASSATIQAAFLESGALGVVFVFALLWLMLRSVRLSLLALAPLALAGLMTLAHCALLGPDLNLANIIAMPLLFGMGVAYDIYFVAAWQQGRRDLLASPLNRAVIYSAVTNAAAFGALAISPHPGTASMGVVLSVSLVYSLVCVMLVLPPLLKLFAPGKD
ncbi:hopanoid biosynthesis-associated RND transporter HpnN [Roseococcus sp. SYP-B2431]|uniref:MMPL family transporter n=1 Tax=Roseococcus sp. SYP-B2431 TaxID=2496640 RepID=UPI00103E737B|nr:MMPL family transporter [Roseococcus sp. SYP-B2431]TCH99802.1 hopanoid biosynthesis-associated RND transporter HpnN [Roseococcus sp. SYP-B2431]